MSNGRFGALLPFRPAATVPWPDGLKLILAGTAYLLVICALQLVALVNAATNGPLLLPRNVMEVRDVVALFGWVGLMISGVSVIIVPNHLKVRVRPKSLPRLHLAVANVGLVGYFVSAISVPGGVSSSVFLALTSASFFAFGVGLLATVYPFVRQPVQGARDGVAPRAPSENPA